VTQIHPEASNQQQTQPVRVLNETSAASQCDDKIITSHQEEKKNSTVQQKDKYI
jgi:hypothetical protein